MSTVGEDEDRSLTTELLPAEPKAVVHSDFTLNHYDIAHSHANFDVVGDGMTGKAYGSFTIDGTSLSDFSTDDHFTLQDAKGNRVRFIIDKSSSDVTGAQTGADNDGTPTVTIGLSGCSDKADVTSRFHGAINACQPTLHISAAYQRCPSTGVIQLFQLIPGRAYGDWTLSATACNLSACDGMGTLTGMVGGASHGQAPFSSRFQLVRSPQSSGISSRETKLEG